MKILWCNWKDPHHPQAGGAEVVNHELCKRLVADGHQVTLLTARYAGAKRFGVVDGVRVIRVGRRRLFHSAIALGYYVLFLRNLFDVVLEVVNTAPYFVTLVPSQAKTAVLYHMLAREIWRYQTGFPLNMLGQYILEPLATWLLACKKQPVMTVSKSTKVDLIRGGFARQQISIISEGITLSPVVDLRLIKKKSQPTILSLGAVRPMKQTADIVHGFEILKTTIPNAQLIIAGDMSGAYGKSVQRMVEQSSYTNDITMLGRVSQEQKISLLQSAQVVCVTSVKEGWGLVVTESNSQGTPCVVYAVDGLRDSVRDGITGLVCQHNTPSGLAEQLQRILSDDQLYTNLQHAGWQWSQQITFEQSYSDFKRTLGL